MNEAINFFNRICVILDVNPDLVLIKDKKTFDKSLAEIETQPYMNIVSKGQTLFQEGYTNPLVIIDLDKHKNQEELLSIAHELRHVYQTEVAFHDKHNEETKYIELLRYSFANYSNSSVKGYELQAVEQDANAFVQFIIEKLLNKRVDVYYKDDLYKYLYKNIEVKFGGVL